MNRLASTKSLKPCIWIFVILSFGHQSLDAQEAQQWKDVDSLITKAKSLIEEDNKLAKSLLDQAKLLSEEKGYWEGVALVLKNFGVLEDISGNTQGAQTYYDEALALYREHDVSDDRFTDIQLNKGVAYYLSGQNDLALQQYLLAYQGYTKSHNQKRISSVLNNLGIIYRIKKDYTKARVSYFESYNIKLALGDSLGGAKNLNNIAMLYGHENQLDSSIHYFSESKRLFQLNGYDGNAQLVNLDLGQTYYVASNYNKAIELLSEVFNSEVIEYASAKQRIGGILALAESYREIGQYEQSHDLLISNKGYIEDHSTQSDLVDIYAVFSASLADKNDYKNAYDYLLKNKNLQSELKADNRLKYEEEMTAKFNLLGKENELQAQEIKLASQRKTRDRLIVGVGFVSILSTLLYLLLRTKNRLNSDLENNNNLLNKALNDKNVLLKEIHHRVKNNLQIISSLLNLQRRHQNNEHASAAFLEGQNRVKSMSMIHQLLYQEDQLTSINTRTYADKLVNSLSAAYKVDPTSITFVNEVDEITLDVDTMIPLGLILNELITNAFKYAFGERSKGLLGISLKDKDQFLEVKVYDDGPGFPSDFQMGENNSFGYKLIHSLSRKLEASISLEQTKYNTVTVTVSNYKTSS